MGKKIILLFVVALAMRLVALSFFSNAQSLIHEDSKDYLAVAQNLVAQGVYSMDNPDANQRTEPDNFRTPLYPFFLVPFVYFNQSPYVVAVIQDILTALGIVLIYFLGKRVFDEKIAFWGSLIFALEPYSALLNNQLLTEWLFTITLAPALLLLALYVKEHNIKHLYISSALFALAALTKPLALPILILIPIIALFIKRDRSVFVCAFLIAIVIAPWIIRNKISIDKWSFSTIGEYNLYNYNAKHFNRWLTEQNEEPQGTGAYPILSLDKYFKPEKADAYLSAGKNFILANPLNYASFIFVKLPALFLDTGYTTITDGLNSGRTVTDVILIGGRIFFLLIAILTAVNFAFKSKVLVVMLLAIALVASPFGAARYRVAINPILFMLALNALYLLKSKKFSESSGQEPIHA